MNQIEPIPVNLEALQTKADKLMEEKIQSIQDKKIFRVYNLIKIDPILTKAVVVYNQTGPETQSLIFTTLEYTAKLLIWSKYLLFFLPKDVKKVLELIGLSLGAGLKLFERK